MPENNLHYNKLVSGMTLEDDEYERESKKVTGKLYVSQSPFEEWPPQCFIDGVQVDPDTVEQVEDSDT